MKRILIATALAAAIGFAIARAADSPSAADSPNATDSRRNITVIASEIASSLIKGIILGAEVGPYVTGLVPAHIESRVAASGYAPAQSTDSNSVADE